MEKLDNCSSCNSFSFCEFCDSHLCKLSLLDGVRAYSIALQRDLLKDILSRSFHE